MSDVNKHAEIIRKTVYHSFPYNTMIPNFKGPHAEDCGGCIIEAELDKLVEELESLSHVDAIIADLNRERNLRHLLSEERREAFKRAAVDDEGQSVIDVVDDLIAEQNRLKRLLSYVEEDLDNLVQKMKER